MLTALTGTKSWPLVKPHIIIFIIALLLASAGVIYFFNANALANYLQFFEVLIGVPLAIVGFFWALDQINDIAKSQKLTAERKTLERAIIIPSQRIRPFSDVYDDLIKLHTINASRDAFIIDATYLQRTVGKFFDGHLQFDNNRDFRFPVAAKQAYLLSQNAAFKAVPQNVLVQDRATTNSAIDKAISEFLVQFQLEDLPAFLREIGIRIWDNPTFDLNAIGDSAGQLTLRFQLGSYAHYVQSHEVLRHELYYHYLKHGTQQIDASHLPVRRAFDVKTLDDAFDLRGRPATLGINVFTVFAKPGGKYCTFFQQRSHDLAENPGVFNVVPAGTFQPLSQFGKRVIERQLSFLLYRFARTYGGTL